MPMIERGLTRGVLPLAWSQTAKFGNPVTGPVVFRGNICCISSRGCLTFRRKIHLNHVVGICTPFLKLCLMQEEAILECGRQCIYGGGGDHHVIELVHLNITSTSAQDLLVWCLKK